MAKIPFKVSARTARLIGRENIASSKGAIIELVKNGYDADSLISVVFFDNIFSELPKTLSSSQYDKLIERGISESFLEIYEANDEEYKLIDGIDENDFLKLKKSLAEKSTLYIIDAGEGMTQQIIREHWMTIGTNHKLFDMFTASGRVKAGAKGIGRFALDKLGSKCEMITVFNPELQGIDKDENGKKTKNTGYKWTVNWDDFEKSDNATIDDISAELVGIKTDSLEKELAKAVEGLNTNIFAGNFKFGTMLKITGLRDIWEDYYVEQLFSDLEVLVPPKETGDFKILLQSSLNEEKYGEVLGSICDDYDYKLVAKANEEQSVEITIYRKEYDTELIDPEFFKRPAMEEFPYTKEDFQNGFWKTTKTFSSLIPGYKNVDDSDTLSKIGKFDFTFYFMKRTYSSYDAERFNYRAFMSHDRKDWLGKFGGIKLFRDNFRVRPYGEVKDAAFDWLGLGNRKAASPAGVAKEDGGYRVEPENIAGAINISRITNVNFDDKSSREGVQENQEFIIFKKLIAEIINVFEVDRSLIAREMSLFYKEKNREKINREQAEELARKILDTKKRLVESGQPPQNPELTILAELNEQKDQELERLRDEQKVLRGLASSGIVLASFSHDLSKLSLVLDSRIDKLKNLISEKVFEKDYAAIEDRKNPFSHMENMRKQDVKLQNWLKFSLGSARKDKRKRNQLYFNAYFDSFKHDWSTVLHSRGIELDISNVSPVFMRIFEIDLDSVFNNLLVNSIDAFNLSKLSRSRKVTINVYNSEKEIFLDYYDSGPGLSADIDVPEKIFEPLYTTKRNPKTGEEEGTGLGMWILKLIVTDNDGVVKLLFPEEGGFGLRINFPVKFKKA